MPCTGKRRTAARSHNRAIGVARWSLGYRRLVVPRCVTTPSTCLVGRNFSPRRETMTERMSVRGGLLAGLLLAAVACGGTANAPSASPSPTPAPLVKTATATVAGSSKTILVGPNGMTLYYYLPDKGGKITCTAQGLGNWPALLAPSGQPTGRGTSD